MFNLLVIAIYCSSNQTDLLSYQLLIDYPLYLELTDIPTRPNTPLTLIPLVAALVITLCGGTIGKEVCYAMKGGSLQIRLNSDNASVIF